jgi:hypothetical protein
MENRKDNGELMEFLESLSFGDRRIFEELMNDEEYNTQLDTANEGVMLKRQNWTTKSLLDKKISRAVMLLAKQNNDPMYQKFVKFFKLSRVWRARLRTRYWGKARAIVIQAGGGTGVNSISVADILAAQNKAKNPVPSQVKK